MTKQDELEKPNISSTAFFVAVSVILLLVGAILAVGNPKNEATIDFGHCEMKGEIARTDLQKAQGLSGRSVIAKDYAMLFPYNKDQPYFWMKDMLTSIDIVWLADNQVIAIDAKVPVDDGARNYQPAKPIDWVIEVAAGRAEECGVREGTIIRGLRS
jgi:uncharacterized membrane protein (UPF0127 family)